MIHLGEPTRVLHSAVIPTSQHVSWTVHNFVGICQTTKALSACSCVLEVPIHGGVTLSKWRVSLASGENNSVRLNVKHLAPGGGAAGTEQLTYQMAVKFGAGGTWKETDVMESSTAPYSVSIGPADTLIRQADPEGNLQFNLAVTVFTQDHWEQ